MNNVNQTKSFQKVLFFSVAATAIGPAALWVHDFMLVSMHIPDPPGGARGPWYMWSNRLIELVFLSYFCRLLPARFRALPTLIAGLTCGLLCVMLNEVLRIIVIDTFLSSGGWSKGAFIYITAGSIPALLAWLSYGASVYILLVRQKSLWLMFVGVALISWAGVFVFEPGLKLLSTTLQTQLVSFDRPQAYFTPYPLKIYLIIYVTFAETALAALAANAVLWPGLRGSPWKRTAIVATLILGIRGRWFALLIGSLSSSQSLGAALASESQFFLETLSVSLLASLTFWGWLKVSRDGAEPAKADEIAVLH